MNCRKPIAIGVWRVGCGQCLPCRINRRRLWTHRLVIEGEQHEKKCFVTLTYENEPPGGTLVPQDLKNWLKRFRKRVAPEKIRYFSVGEYGEEKGRPHYHALIFGFPPCPARSKFNKPPKTPCACPICKTVQETWNKGRVDVAPFEEGVAQYVAKYVTKKMTNKNDERLKGRHPEFARLSLKPGIGAEGALVLSRHLSQHRELVLDENGDVPSAITYGNKNKPLGNYLRQILRKELNVDKALCLQKKQETLYEEKSQMLELFKGEALYKEEQRLREEELQKCINLEAKFNIYNNKGE